MSSPGPEIRLVRPRWYAEPPLQHRRGATFCLPPKSAAPLMRHLPPAPRTPSASGAPPVPLPSEHQDGRIRLQVSTHFVAVVRERDGSGSRHRRSQLGLLRRVDCSVPINSIDVSNREADGWCTRRARAGEHR